MKELFEQKEFWEKYREDIPKKIRSYKHEAINLIPSEVESILDIGCGEGSFLNMLQDTNFVTGLDLSGTALEYVKNHKVQGNASNLPFRSESFDLIACLEVLEHLKRSVFVNSLSEIKRVTSKYIIISVPNKEPLEYFRVVCPLCNCHFNIVGHKRKFNTRLLDNIFSPEFRLEMIKETGNTVEYPTYNKFLFWAFHSYIKPKPPRLSICPLCDHKIEKKENRISYSQMPASLKILKKIADLIWPPRVKRPWLLALYERNK